MLSIGVSVSATNAEITTADASTTPNSRNNCPVNPPRNERTLLRRDGVPLVGVVLRPQPGANYIEIAEEFRRRVEQIKPELPADVIVSYGFDVTDFIRASIHEVGETIFLAMTLVVAIIFLFLLIRKLSMRLMK